MGKRLICYRLVKWLARWDDFRTIDWVKVLKYPYSIHTNHLELKGNDNKPFDVSFDSFEKYFSKYKVNLKTSVHFEILEIPIKVISKEDLVTTYEIGIQGSNTTKINEFRRKLNKLKS